MRHTVRELTQVSRDWLARKGVEAGRIEVERLMSSVLGCRPLDLFLDLDRPLTTPEVDAFRELLRRRGKREPLAYILGEWEFFGLAMEVNPAVLIPRPETEHLVELGLDILKTRRGDEPACWLDVGTGSGCIAIALAHKRGVEADEAWAVDIAADALEVARRNADRHGLGERIRFVEGELCAPVKESGPFDLILSNPPYIAESEREGLQAEVGGHEPEGALFAGGEDGLDVTRRLVTEAFDLLAPGGALAVEIGAGRCPAARALFEEAGYEALEVVRDYGGHERIVSGRRPA